MQVEFHVPTKPYSVVDAINRVAAAQGSIGYAMASVGADYNGHNLNLWFNDYKGYYICEYFWGERVVLARSYDIREALDASLLALERQGKGANLRISVRPEDAAIVRKYPQVIEGKEELEACSWYTWRHREVGNARYYEKHMGVPASAALLMARDPHDFEFLCSRAGRNEISNRKPLPEALGVCSLVLA